MCTICSYSFLFGGHIDSSYRYFVSIEKQRKTAQRSANKGYEQLGKDEATGGEPLATLIKIPAVEFYLRRARYWS